MRVHITLKMQLIDAMLPLFKKETFEWDEIVEAVREKAGIKCDGRILKAVMYEMLDKSGHKRTDDMVHEERYSL